MAALGALQAYPALAQQAYALTVNESGFQPSTLQVPAGVKFKLTVTNATEKSSEFESSELNREKVVPAGSSAIVFIGPLAPGSYPFFDDFDAKKRGQIIAK
jgi:hypothetical protein